MSVMASQITGISIVYSTVSSEADKKNIKAPCHWSLWPVTRKMFPFDDIIMVRCPLLIPGDTITVPAFGYYMPVVFLTGPFRGDDAEVDLCIGAGPEYHEWINHKHARSLHYIGVD